ncbi:MAG: 3'-5' exonuclease [Nitrososphaerales archaeon]
MVITFNGDEFDLKYLYHRAKKLGFNKSEIPIYLGRDFAGLKHGVHLEI